eukprot:TRINITY_DN15598_c4_g1_i1.p1 TRINITY_DN15598_c4_g1~~TRINITY_DN15598_c4_g1_i1.p1  ORF type:complete len:697 (+),score=251.27 TRINITY_DN15598_c4_g1_i1:164-2254(+)
MGERKDGKKERVRERDRDKPERTRRRDADSPRRRRERDTSDGDGEKERPTARAGGFRPAPWMASDAGPRPGTRQLPVRAEDPPARKSAAASGAPKKRKRRERDGVAGGSSAAKSWENAVAADVAKDRPEIQLCKMRWDSEQLMDKRVGNIVPCATTSLLSDRFRDSAAVSETPAAADGPSAAATPMQEDLPEQQPPEDPEQRQVHLAALEALGIPVGLVSEGGAAAEPEVVPAAPAPALAPLPGLGALSSIAPGLFPAAGGLYPAGGLLGSSSLAPIAAAAAALRPNPGPYRSGRRGRWAADREGPIENPWPELPSGPWQRDHTLMMIHNAPCSTLLLAMLPPDLNSEDTLRAHFRKYGFVAAIYPRINFVEHSRHDRQGLAVVDMGGTPAAMAAHRAQEAVGGNRFVKVFYAPEAVRQRVERLKIDRMMAERRQLLDERRAASERASSSSVRVQEAKGQRAELQRSVSELKAQLADEIDEGDRAVLRLKLQDATRRLKAVLTEELAAMEQHRKDVADTKKQPAAAAWAARVNWGQQTLDYRPKAIKLGKLPRVWEEAPAKLRRAMEKYGAVAACAVAAPAPGQRLAAFVRFAQRHAAEKAVRALGENNHRPVWLDASEVEREWPRTGEIDAEAAPPQPAQPPAPTPSADDDEALIDDAMGMHADELIPKADLADDGEEIAGADASVLAVDDAEES